MRKLIPFLVLAVAGAAVGKQPIARIDGPARVALEPKDPRDPTRVRVAPLFWLTADDSVSDAPLTWIYEPNKLRTFKTYPDDDGNRGVLCKVTGLGVGRHRFLLIASGEIDGPDGKKIARLDGASLDVEVYDPGATPTPAPDVIPKPPGPDVPVPPVPDPVPVGPSPLPGPVGNMQALVLFQRESDMTREQLDALYNKNGIYPFLDVYCQKDADGNPAWRSLDPDTDVAGDKPEWRNAVAAGLAEPTPLPKLLLFSGTSLARVHAIKNRADATAFIKASKGE